MTSCVICLGELDPSLAPAVTHPTCLGFEEPGEENPFSQMLKRELIDIITWADKENPRSKQVKIGPSEIGDPCDRRVGYRLAGIPACNVDFDPWAGIVGTAIHAWLDDAVNLWMTSNQSQDFATETALSLNEFVEGHSDLYWKPHATVVDWKGAGPSVMRKLRAEGPSVGYIAQTHIYGYGFEQAGWPVRKVALAFLPRAGWLRDMVVWSADYDRAIAVGAINRLYLIARMIIDLNILIDGNTHRWEQIDAFPSNACGFCPWYQPSKKDTDIGADANGCPGR